MRLLFAVGPLVIAVPLAASCTKAPDPAICASTVAFSEIKEVIFYEARQRFRGDSKYLDDFHRDLLVTVASPTATGVGGGVTDCRGKLTVTIPVAYRNNFHQQAALTADIRYSSQAAGGGYTVSGYDPVLTQVLEAARSLQSPADASPDPQPASTSGPIPPVSGSVASEPAKPPVERAWYVTGLDPDGDNWLALKATPSLGATRLAKLGPGTILLSDGRRSGLWLAVRTVDGIDGWVASRYVACCRN